MRAIFLILLSFIPFLNNVAQEKISFLASDSLLITADLYLKDSNLPFIVLCHQANSSKGEFIEIANRLLKLDYNCLALDLRTGDWMNDIKNETAERAKNQNISHSIIDVKKDIEASIRYIKKINKNPVVLLGSSFSASLCLIIANNNLDVKAVIAFSPGEYFRPDFVVKDAITGLNKPVFVTATSREYEYIVQMLSGVDDDLKTIYKPSKGTGIHGAKILWQTSEASDECWLELLFFFKKIKV